MIEVTTLEEFSNLFEGQEDFIVDFARRNGCVPCRRLEPHYKAAAAKVDVPMYVVYLDEADVPLFNYATGHLKVLGTPTIIRFRWHGDTVLEGRTAPVLIQEINNG